MNSTIKTLAIALAMGLSVSGAFAAASASDTAANYSAGGWSTSNLPNLGSGFGAWFESDQNFSPPYCGGYLDLTSYGNNDGVLSAGVAFGTYANSGGGTEYVTFGRSFNTGGGSASLVNQTFSVGLGAKGSPAGQSFGGSGSMALNIGTAFGLTYNGAGSDNFLLSVDGGAAAALPVNYANLSSGLLVSLSVSGAVNSATEGYSLVISPFAGGPAIYSTSGTFNASAYGTDNFSVTTTHSPADQFFNNPTISAVPEPATLALFGLSGLTLLAIRRK
jgi:hypothetical protein